MIIDSLPSLNQPDSELRQWSKIIGRAFDKFRKEHKVSLNYIPTGHYRSIGGVWEPIKIVTFSVDKVRE
jgi:hypothetical protein